MLQKQKEMLVEKENNEARVKKYSSQQGGWAIMSALIAIFIGLIMIGGIFGLVNMAMQGSKVNQAQQNIGTIRTATQQLFGGQPDYSGLDTSLAQSAGVFPESMVDSSGNVNNVWSGSVALSTGSTPTQFDLTYNGVPEEACIQLAKFGYGSWTAVDVGGTAVSQTGGTAVSDAVSACNGASNTITFTSQ